MEINTYRIVEIAQIRSGKRLPLGHVFSDVPTAYPYIRARDIKGGRIATDGLAFLKEETQKSIKRYIIEEGDIAITIVANIGDVGYCTKESDKANLTENAVRLTGFDKRLVDSKYLAFYLGQVSMKKHMELLAAGAAQAKLGIYKIEKIKVSLPPCKIQHRIASILSDYEQLVENNSKRIRLLEQIAENIYKDWFSFHRIKDSAKEIRLTDIITVHRGLSYSSEEIDCEDGDDLINLKNIQAFGGFRLDGTKKYNGRYKNDQIVKEGDLVMGVTDMTQDRRTVGSVALIPTVSAISVISADLIKLESSIDNVFLYAMFRWGNVSKYISQFANGANVLHLRPQVLKNIKVLLPPKEMIDDYVFVVKPMIETINKLNTENDILIKQRDLLLPRLMSGKLDVK